MIDLLKYTPDRLRPTDTSIRPRSTTEGFLRKHFTPAKDGTASMVLSFPKLMRAIIRLRAFKLKDGRWAITKIEAVLASLLHGHNGRTIKTDGELHLALTILVHILKMVVQPECHGRILPGLGIGNQGFINYSECSIQVQDPAHAFLCGSHLGRMKTQHKPTGIYLGQSTKMLKREVAVSIYDKNQQLRFGTNHPAGIEGTRIEVIVKKKLRLANDVKATTFYSGKSGPVVATLALQTSYAILRKNLTQIIGIGWIQDGADLGSLCKNARILASALGERIGDPREVHRALEAYRAAETPSPNTFRDVETDLKAYALRTVVPDPLAIVPHNPADIRWSEVHWPEREAEWARLLRDIGAPTEPDPAIVAAWSQTTFLPEKPLPMELIGDVMPGPLPFPTDTL